MLVKDLIAHLQTLDGDAEVYYRHCSDWSPMDEDQIRTVTLHVSEPDPGWACEVNFGDTVKRQKTVVGFPGN